MSRTRPEIAQSILLCYDLQCFTEHIKYNDLVSGNKDSYCYLITILISMYQVSISLNYIVVKYLDLEIGVLFT